MTIKTTVNTNMYQWNTGHKPRGTGSWAFGTKKGDVLFWKHGTYSEAKAAAIKECQAAGIWEIYVLP